MALRARMRLNQQLGCTRTRSCMTFVLVGTLFSGLLLSHWLLRPRPRWTPTRGGFRLPNSHTISNATMLRYSQFHPELSSQRDRINFLMQVTDFGKIGMKEVLKFWKIPSHPPRYTSRNARIAWILPLTMNASNRYMPEFFKLSKAWLGDVGDSTPRVMQDFLQTVQTALDESVPSKSNSQTQNDKLGGLKAKNGHQSCAVVGNSGILLNQEYGEQIDSHDVVIRVNNPLLATRFERYVGSKTSLSFINSNVLHSWSIRAQCKGHNYAQGIPTVLYMCQPSHFLDLAKCSMQTALDKSLFVTPTLFDGTCATIAKWYSVTNFLRTTGRTLSEWDSVHDELEFHYSSGMQAVVLALGLCDRVDMFGFGKAPNTSHHFHSRRKEELSLHDYAAEYIFYDDLVHNRTVPLLTDASISIPPVRIFV